MSHYKRSRTSLKGFFDVPKTLVIGTDEKQPILDCQKPRSKLKQLLNVLSCLATADIHGSHSIGNIGLVPAISCIEH